MEDYRQGKPTLESLINKERLVILDADDVDIMTEWCRNKPEEAAIQLLRYRKLYGKA